MIIQRSIAEVLYAWVKGQAFDQHHLKPYFWKVHVLTASGTFPKKHLLELCRG